MNYKGYEYEVLIDEIIPPIAKRFYYAANLHYLMKRSSAGIHYLDPDIREVHGKTKDEALEKIDRYIKIWIDRKIKQDE